MEHIALEHAAELIEQADALVIAAGAGMGVDSGMPDFRGQQGFWAAYPALAAAGIDFTSIANPKGFVQDASRAWGFYGHRLSLYRQTVPHAGFAILKRWADAMPLGATVFTSNVDGQSAVEYNNCLIATHRQAVANTVLAVAERTFPC